jgi:translocation and assembly module TamB
VAKAAKETGMSILNRMRIDVRTSIPDNLILRGKDLRVGNASMGLGNINVTVGGDLRVMRQPGTPTIVVGSVNTVRGSYDYRGRRFDILRDGRISFQGARVNDPALDVTAQRVIEPQGIEARIHIEGTAQRPQLRFSSNPPMDESDVIALIIFNRPLSDLESGERGAIADVAGSAVGGLLVSPLTDTIGRALNLDVLEVGTTTTDTGGTGGTVTVGKQVDDNLFFRFRQQFGSQEVSEFILEYQLARFLRLQASAAEGEGVGRAQRSLTRRIERAGLDLLFYFSY